MRILELPAPDWGLRCRNCRAPLAGAAEHACPRCRAPYDPADLLAMRRPIAPLGARCGSCRYTLDGLLTSVCPECGRRLFLHQLLAAGYNSRVRYWSQTQRETPPLELPAARFRGDERPLPEFGLRCLRCDAPLKGAAADACPACGAAFHLQLLLDPGPWCDVGPWIAPAIYAVAGSLLEDAGIACIVQNAALRNPIGTVEYCVAIQLLVPRTLFFDALHALAQPAPSPSAPRWAEWQCACGEQNPPGFDVCWNCSRPYGSR